MTRVAAFIIAILLALPHSGDAQGQRAAQGSRGSDQDRRGGPGPVNRQEAESRVREAIMARMRATLALPDSQLNQLIAVSFRYRDSTLTLNDQERSIRGELNREVSAPRGAAVNEARISCLLDAFWTLQQTQLELRRTEDREISAFLTPSRRLRYMGLQDNLHSVMDAVIDQMNERLGRGRGDGDARAGGGGGPPPGARGGPPGGRGVGRAGPPQGGRAFFPGPGGYAFTVCPPPSGG